MQRLKTRNQFQAVLAGRTLVRTPHFALHGLALDRLANSNVDGTDAPNAVLFGAPGVWLGAMVPKRWAKRAVTRNAIKREIYGVSADFESCFSQSAYVVRLRSTFDGKHFVSATSATLKLAVREELQHLFSSLQFAAGAPTTGVQT